MTYSLTRVRSQDGSAFGWFDSKSHAIRIDSEMGMALLAFFALFALVTQ